MTITIGLKPYNGAMRFDDPMGLGPAPVGDWPTDTGFSETGPTITAATMIMDWYSDDKSSKAYNDLGPTGTTRDTTLTYYSSGGFGGRGYHRIIPGTTAQEYAAFLRGLVGFSSVGDATKITYSFMIRIGSEYRTSMLATTTTKFVEWLRADGSSRPMMIPHGYGSTNVLGSCMGTVCNCGTDPDNPIPYNDNGEVPNIPTGEWVWCSGSINLNEVDNGTHKLRWWDESDTIHGTGPEQYCNADGPYGSTISTLSTFMTYVGNNIVASPTENYHLDLCLFRVDVGTDAGVSPPYGMQGHVPGDWA